MMRKYIGLTIFLLVNSHALLATDPVNPTRSHLYRNIQAFPKKARNAKVWLETKIYAAHIIYLRTYPANKALLEYLKRAGERDWKHYAKVSLWIYSWYPSLFSRSETTLLQTLVAVYWEIADKQLTDNQSLECSPEESSRRLTVIASFIEKLLRWVPIDTWNLTLDASADERFRQKLGLLQAHAYEEMQRRIEMDERRREEQEAAYLRKAGVSEKEISRRLEKMKSRKATRSKL